MKLTRHNGRFGKNGAFNPKHNDRRFDIENSEHIDESRARHNVFWDCYQGFHYPADQEQEERIVYSFEQVEQRFYSEQYDDFCQGQHERNKKTGHSSRDRTPEDLRLDKKTCPEESLIQIGTMEQSVPPEILTRIAAEFFQEFDRRFGEHIHILDWSLHLDEATPHIHERHVFDCKNRYGEIAPQQENALKALGFELPYPDQKSGKHNNSKMSFDAACRALLFDICRQHGLHLDQEPEYGGRAYLEKQDYILMKQKEKLTGQEKMIASKEKELEAITVRIEDTKTFVDEIADTAYEKAAESIARTVQREVRREDFNLIASKRKEILNDSNLNERSKRYFAGIFSDLLKQFNEVSQHITSLVTALLRNPAKKEEVQEPIKESILAKLTRASKEADAAAARSRATHSLPQKNHHYEPEL